MTSTIESKSQKETTTMETMCESLARASMHSFGNNLRVEAIHDSFFMPSSKLKMTHSKLQDKD